MIPLRDTIPSRTAPLVNNALLAVNALAFVLQALQGRRLGAVLQAFAFIPDRLFHPAVYEGWGFPPAALTLVTAMFLHGGPGHLAGNMLYLWIFGDNVEDALGHFRYLVFYLSSGILAGLVQGILSPGSTIPVLGASGAIAGLLGAYFVLYPRARVVTLVPLFFLFPLVEVPAAVYLVLWLLFQLWMGSASLLTGGPDAGGVAWGAHVGGFVAGLLLLPLLRPRQKDARYWIR